MLNLRGREGIILQSRAFEVSKKILPDFIKNKDSLYRNEMCL